MEEAESDQQNHMQERSDMQDKLSGKTKVVAFADPIEKTMECSSDDREAILERVAAEKRLALIKAWEESEKIKAENKAHKKLSAVEAWELSKKASVEAQLRKIEENLEKKRAECTETMKNKIADVHRAAQEKRAMVEAKHGEDIIKIEETAAKFRAKGYVPKRFLGIGCFGRPI